MQAVIDICIEKLAAEASNNSNNARRLFHGRGHCYPGYEHVVVTWFPPYIHISLYAEVNTVDLDLLVNALIAARPDIVGVAVQARDGRRTETEIRYGEVPDEHLVYENGLAYWVQPKRNQNVGLFLDMGHVREALAVSMPGARVLNLFAYTCAFSVAAVAHGAALVVNNDMNSNVLNVGRRNHLANDQDLRRVRMMSHNLFKSWGKIRKLGPYDVIIIDPPTNQRGSFVAEKHYPQVLKQLERLGAPNARVFACLNSPFLGEDFLQNLMARWCSKSRFVQTMPAHPDFPEAFEGRGLKVLEFRLSK
jgi:23S rRNA (cytosine1962-C5)-methyltransferase